MSRRVHIEDDEGSIQVPPPTVKIVIVGGRVYITDKPEGIRVEVEANEAADDVIYDDSEYWHMGERIN